MPGESKNGMQCIEFDALLTEALDGTLVGAKLERFRAHANVCSTCGPLFAEVDAGRRLLLSLEEVEPPTRLLANILASTSGLDTARIRGDQVVAPRQPSFTERVREWLQPALSPVFGVIRQPRFAMSFGMAFFSVSMALNVAGVKVSDIRHVDLRPSALVRNYHTTTGRMVKYYENIRFVYEIESKVREFKRATTPAQPAPNQEQPHRDNNTSGQPEQRQERNYSQEENQPVMASAPDAPLIVTVTTTRRFV